MALQEIAPRSPLQDARAWTASTLDPSADWYYRLSADGAAALERVVTGRGAASLAELAPGPELRRALQAELEPVRQALETGRGFVIQQVPELSRVSREEATAAYWLLGQCLGRPVVQNVAGTLLYDVRDTGRSVESGARFSVTNADSSFHTDNSFGDRVTDYVGLLCLRTARRGGVNQLVSGWPVVDLLAREYPRELETLRRPFPVDRRGGTREGEAPTVDRPVLETRGGEVLFRYLRYWIQAGAEKAGEPLTAEQVRALDVLDDVLRRPELRTEFSLEPGQILWVNNRWLLHSRTAFEDYEEPEQRRHLVRLWLETEKEPGCGATSTAFLRSP